MDTNNTIPNKSYKIDPVMNYVFLATYMIYKRSKFTEFLIIKHFNYPTITELSTPNKPEFLKMMIDDVFKQTNNVASLKPFLQSKRMKELKEIIHQEVSVSHKRVVLNVRIDETERQRIKMLAKDVETVGEVIEIAIAHFISNCPEKLFDVITFALISTIRTEQTK